MGFKNGFKGKIFPKFISISQFAVGKSIFIIMGERMEITVLILSEIISKVIATPMAIAEDGKFGTVIKCYTPGVLKSIGKSFGRWHIKFRLWRKIKNLPGDTGQVIILFKC